LVPILILMFSTGFIEELIFRGMMQRAATEALGRFGLPYVAALFAVLHVGYLSVLDVVFVLIVGLFFGWVAARTHSIVGVTLSHGLTNIVLFLVMPLSPVFNPPETPFLPGTPVPLPATPTPAITVPVTPTVGPTVTPAASGSVSAFKTPGVSATLLTAKVPLKAITLVPKTCLTETPGVWTTKKAVHPCRCTARVPVKWRGCQRSILATSTTTMRTNVMSSGTMPVFRKRPSA
jgi:hypothetical protein